MPDSTTPASVTYVPGQLLPMFPVAQLRRWPGTDSQLDGRLQSGEEGREAGSLDPQGRYGSGGQMRSHWRSMGSVLSCFRDSVL